MEVVWQQGALAAVNTTYHVLQHAGWCCTRELHQYQRSVKSLYRDVLLKSSSVIDAATSNVTTPFSQLGMVSQVLKLDT